MVIKCHSEGFHLSNEDKIFYSLEELLYSLKDVKLVDIEEIPKPKSTPGGYEIASSINSKQSDKEELERLQHSDKI